jgi:hypothetical protein
MLILISGRQQSVGVLLFLPLFCGEAEFVVPFLSEASDEGFSEALVEFDMLLFAKHSGAMADVPSVVLEGAHGRSVSACLELLDADGIEVA